MVNVAKVPKDILSDPDPYAILQRSRLRAIRMNEPRVPSTEGSERRTKRRFQIAQEVRYRMDFDRRVPETGTGRTLDISSAGVSFTTQNLLAAGTPVELSMNWPVLLNDSCPIKLMMYGNVIRSDDKVAAVAIQRYEFRTQGSRNLLVGQNSQGSIGS